VGVRDSVRGRKERMLMHYYLCLGENVGLHFSLPFSKYNAKVLLRKFPAI